MVFLPLIRAVHYSSLCSFHFFCFNQVAQSAFSSQQHFRCPTMDPAPPEFDTFDEPSTVELTNLSRQWQHTQDPPAFALWMASSEVDQKFLGFFAKSTGLENPLLSSMLYKVLGLSVRLARKLVRARRLRRLDPTRDTRYVQQLYHHILWLSREGLVITEQYVLPMVSDYLELKVLSYKLRASFYHIFVLFHNQPSINQAASSMRTEEPVTQGSMRKGKGKAGDPTPVSRSPSISKTPAPQGGPVRGPPGLAPPPTTAQPSAAFLLPAVDYRPQATSCFVTAAALSDQLLPGSHPLRLSVKLEYVAYMYDCLHDPEGSRRMAKRTIADVYNAPEGMDNESFEDAAEMVGILGKMMKRGLGGAGGSESQTGSGNIPPDPGSTPRLQYSQLPSKKTPPQQHNGANAVQPAVPSPGMTNPI